MIASILAVLNFIILRVYIFRHNVVFGSSAPWRVKDFQSLFPSLKFKVVGPKIKEYEVTTNGNLEERKSSDPAELSTAVATAKNIAVSKKLKDAKDTLIITIDSVAFYENEIREKPESKEQCLEWFLQYKIKPIQVCTSVVVYNTKSNKYHKGFVYGSQLFKPELSEDIINGLIEEGTVMYCCGGFLVDLPQIEPYLSDRIGTTDEIVGTPLKLIKKLVIEADKD